MEDMELKNDVISVLKLLSSVVVNQYAFHLPSDELRSILSVMRDPKTGEKLSIREYTISLINQLDNTKFSPEDYNKLISIVDGITSITVRVLTGILVSKIYSDVLNLFDRATVSLLMAKILPYLDDNSPMFSLSFLLKIHQRLEKIKEKEKTAKLSTKDIETLAGETKDEIKKMYAAEG